MMFIALGWAAMLVYLISHAYMSWRVSYVRSRYYLLNLVGALGFVISSAAIASWQSVAVNTFWAAISLLSFLNITLERDSPLSAERITAPIFLISFIGFVWSLGNHDLGFSILGWGGTLLYCFGYVLFTARAIRRKRFLVYNTLAAIFLIPIYIMQDNWPAFGMSVSWSAVSVYGFWNLTRQERLAS
ncbi:MAG: CBU_0592 family membrane protein [Hyphococcus sp.]